MLLFRKPISSSVTPLPVLITLMALVVGFLFSLLGCFYFVTNHLKDMLGRISSHDFINLFFHFFGAIVVSYWLRVSFVYEG